MGPTEVQLYRDIVYPVARMECAGYVTLLMPVKKKQ
jgi:hypothetical protein